MNSKIIILFVSVLMFTVSINCNNNNSNAKEDPVVGGIPQKVDDVYLPVVPGITVETWADNLLIPWSLLFLSETEALVSERGGKIKKIVNGKVLNEPYAEIKIAHIGEGGLMGLAKHPDFPEQPFIYIMYTYTENSTLFNKVERYIHKGNSAEFDKIIIEKIPGGRTHDGGRIAFGPDNMLYICTGDIRQAEIAQDLKNTGGKILRVTSDGEIPDDNPFEGNPVFSYGHRNPQGLAWHPVNGDLFSSEHGPSGEYGLSGMDIINVIKKGGNYGWPRVVGAAGVEPYIDPIIMWNSATPPSGMTFFHGDLFIATLRSRALIRIKLNKENNEYNVTAIERWFANDEYDGKYGRLRDAVVGPDNALYVITNNTDGRGRPFPGDDKILRIVYK